MYLKISQVDFRWCYRLYRYIKKLNVPSDVTFRLRTRSILLATRIIGRSDPKSCLSLRMASSALSNVVTSSTENTKMKASKKLSPTSCIEKNKSNVKIFRLCFIEKLLRGNFDIRIKNYSDAV